MSDLPETKKFPYIKAEDAIEIPRKTATRSNVYKTSYVWQDDVDVKVPHMLMQVSKIVQEKLNGKDANKRGIEYGGEMKKSMTQ